MKKFNKNESVKVWWESMWVPAMYVEHTDGNYLDHKVHVVRVTGTGATLWFRRDEDIMADNREAIPCPNCCGIGQSEWIDPSTGELDGAYCSHCNGGGWIEIQVK